MRSGHHALIVFTVRKREGVSQFVGSLFEEPFVNEILTGGKAVKVLAKPMGGHQGATPLKLRFTEDERQDGDIEIGESNAQKARSGWRFSLDHLGKNLRREVLLAGNVEGKTRIGLRRKNLARDEKGTAQTATEFGQKFSRNRTERQKLNPVHSAAAASRFQPYFFSLL